MPVRRIRYDERGETLLELIISLAILGLGLVAIMSGVALSLKSSDIHRKQVTAAAAVRDFAEAIETSVSGSGYVPCATTSSYAGLYTAPSAYAASVKAVDYWTGTTWSPSACTTATDSGVERVTLQVSSGDSSAAGRGAVETLVVIVRKPCGAGSTCS